MPDQLETILMEINDRLTDGTANRRSPLHTPVVGTSDGDLRVMVLRHFDHDTMTLRFHTDAQPQSRGDRGWTGSRSPVL